jgi:hypothetical protein
MLHMWKYVINQINVYSWMQYFQIVNYICVVRIVLTKIIPGQGFVWTNYFDSISLNKPVDLGVFSVLENVSKFTNFPFLHQIVFSWLDWPTVYKSLKS